MHMQLDSIHKLIINMKIVFIHIANIISPVLSKLLLNLGY